MVGRVRISWLVLLLCGAAALSILHLLVSSGDHSTSVQKSTASLCDYSSGKWVLDPSKRALYTEKCPFHRNGWNCLRNGRPGMDRISSWRWVPSSCHLPDVDPGLFLARMRNKNIGFIGDSLNENFVVSMLCILQTADPLARKWKRKGAWRGAFFPSFNVTVGYHRAVLLAKYTELQESSVPKNLKAKRAYRVDIDLPAQDWANVLQFYNVFIFNTGHWWNSDKFPDDTPLVFYKGGKVIQPFLGMKDGLSAVLRHVTHHVQETVPPTALLVWRLQSPRHFEGGEWNQNGSCTSEKHLTDAEVEDWFAPERNRVNREAREMNGLVQQALRGKKFRVLNVTGLSEYRRDAHPAVWLGQKDAHLVWGQDCLHWCLPGLPDAWVQILSQIILDSL